MTSGSSMLAITLSVPPQRRLHETDNALFLVGVVDDALVSVLSFTGGSTPRIRHAGEFGISVRKSYWSFGIATLIIQALIDWAKAGGIVTKLNLRVHSENQRAQSPYEKLGFVREGVLTRDLYFEGQYFDHVCIGISL